LRHQQTAGTGATLPGRDKGRLNDGVDRSIQIRDLIDHQRVIAAHFQGQDLVRAPGKLLMQCIASAARTSEEQPVDTCVRRQCDTGFARTLQQVQHPGWQPGFDPALDGQLSDFGGQLARLENHAVTGQQCRNNMPIRQMTREVVRTEYGNHTMGLVAQNSGGIAQRAAFFTCALAVALHRDRHFVDHAGDFGGRLPEWLAGFFTDATCQFIRVSFKARGKGFKHAQALFKCARGPLRKSLTRGLDGGINLLGIGAITCPQHFLGDRIQRFKGFALPVLPGACNVQRAHYFDSRGATGWADKATART